MAATEDNRHLPDDTQPPLEELLADVLDKAQRAVDRFIGDDDVEIRLRQVKRTAAESSSVPDWVLEVPVEAELPSDEVVDYHLAQWREVEKAGKIAQAAEADREAARFKLRVAKAKAEDMCEAARKTAQDITNEALDQAAVTRRAAELDAERMRLSAERKQFDAAKVFFEVEMMKVRLELEHTRRAAEIEVSRMKLQAEAEYGRARAALAQARIERERARTEADALIQEAYHRATRTYPSRSAAHNSPESRGFAGALAVLASRRDSRYGGTPSLTTMVNELKALSANATDPGGRCAGWWDSVVAWFRRRSRTSRQLSWAVPLAALPAAMWFAGPLPAFGWDDTCPDAADRAAVAGRRVLTLPAFGDGTGEAPLDPAHSRGAVLLEDDPRDVELGTEYPTERADLEVTRVGVAG